MRTNGTPAKKPAEAPRTLKRVTSISRWLARKRPPLPDSVPQVSIVIPVYNGEATIGECLDRLYQSTFTEFETVLVDDGSTDRTREIVSRYPVRVVPSPGRVGPAAARNIGAREARGEILFFIDSDVMVFPDTLTTLMAGLETGDADGFNGVQSARMRHRNLASQYKNIWMRWTYLRQQGDVPLFYTTAAALRREAFIGSGGFDVGYGGPSVEDTAFGQKLKRLGVRVRIHPELEVEHVKRYSLRSLLETDYKRAVSMTRLKLRHPRDIGENNTSIPTTYMASVPLIGLATLLAGVAGVASSSWLAMLSVLALAGTVVLNVGFLNAIRTSDGVGRALTSVGVLWLELLTVGVGTAVGLLSYPFGRRY